MDKFVHEGNLKHYLELIAGTTHEAQRSQILTLLAEKEAKDQALKCSGSS
jgi:hypothetical protein